MSKKATKKAAAKKPAAKKATVKTAKTKVAKKAAKKASTVKTGSKKVVSKKVAVKKAAPKKAAAKKITKPVAKAAAPEKVKKSYPVLLNAIIEGLEERKAHNITVIDLTTISNRSFDYFVIADADSRTHVESIASSVEDEVKKNIQERPFHTEGWQNGEWILLDYVNVVVHVFQKPIREFYNLEGLWADADIQKIN